MKYSITHLIFAALLATGGSAGFAGSDSNSPRLESISLIALDDSEWRKPGVYEAIIAVDGEGSVASVRVFGEPNAALERALSGSAFRAIERSGQSGLGLHRQFLFFQNGVCFLGQDEDDFENLSLPRLVERALPDASDEAFLDGGNVIARVEIDAQGAIVQAKIEEASNIGLGVLMLEAVENWRFEPAIKDGEAIASTVLVPLSAIETARKSVSEPPRIARYRKIELPMALSDRSGEIVLTLHIDDVGRVAKSAIAYASDLELAAFAIKEVKDWRFEPAARDGVPVASRANVPFHFNGGVLESEGVFDSPQAISKGPKLDEGTGLELPPHLSEMPGEVVLTLQIDESGVVRASEVAFASDPELASLVVDAVKDWEYEPALRAGKPSAVKANQPFIFNGGATESNAEMVDILPVAVHSPRPDFGRKRIKDGGFALVVVRIDRFGEVLSAKVRESSAPKLDKACVQAAMNWRFNPAIRDGEAVASSLVIPFVISEKGPSRRSAKSREAVARNERLNFH